MNGVFSAGGCFGALFVAWACDRLGRRASIFVATPIAIVGGAFQTGAVHIAMFLVGRLLSGFAVGRFLSKSVALGSAKMVMVGMLVVLVPLFQSEIAPPATRGFLVSQHGRLSSLPCDYFHLTRIQVSYLSWATYLLPGSVWLATFPPIRTSNGVSR